MTRAPILLIGAGGHARACIDVIEQEGRFDIAGLIGSRPEAGTRVLGYDVLGTDDDLAELRRKYGYAIIAVGQIKTPEPRIRLFAELHRLGYDTPSIVSPRAYVSAHASVGPGTIVMHGAIVNASAAIGRNCIVNSRALVEHDAVVADHCHISTGANVNSGVRIGEGTFIGSGAAVKQLVCIGARSVIGLGERVLADCPAETRQPEFSRP